MTALEALFPVTENLPHEPSSERPRTAEPLAVLARRLADGLRQGDMDALKRFDDFQSALDGYGPDPDLKRIQTLVQTYDFDAALELLEQMIQKERLA